ncbi:MAG: UDP-N-acetylmuramate dehydrogenase [Eubacteriaceae bacterium]|nr:UDP-N-acetylmuramate dehydrogenase [Eubacteriaceae bacterium]
MEEKYIPTEELKRFELLTDVPMSRYTTIHCGGPADMALFPRSEDELSLMLQILGAEKIPVSLIGGGSNLLVGDGGIRGAAVFLSGLGDIRIRDNTVYASAGVALPKLARMAAEASLSGLQFASGIPGTVGGAVVMNAGAYGSEMKDILLKCRVMDEFGDVTTMGTQELDMSYRHSVFSGSDGRIVISALLGLTGGERDSIMEEMKELAARRRTSQPLDMPSAGSTFRRPEDAPAAARLIDDAGLKGLRVGDAMVSTVHAGFIVNAGHASAGEVRELIELVTERVYSLFGVTLQPEIKYMGCF